MLSYWLIAIQNCELGSIIQYTLNENGEAFVGEPPVWESSYDMEIVGIAGAAVASFSDKVKGSPLFLGCMRAVRGTRLRTLRHSNNKSSLYPR